MIADLVHNFTSLYFYEWGIAVVGLILFLFGVVIFAQDVTKRRGRYFLFLAMVIFAWGIANTVLDAAPNPTIAHQSVVALFIIVELIPLTLFSFFYVFPKKGEPISWWRALGISVPYLGVLGVLLVDPNLISGYPTTYQENSIGHTFGKFVGVYLGYITVFLSLTVYILVDKYRTSVGIFKLQTRNMIMAFGVGVILALVFALMLYYLRALSVHNIFLVGFISVIPNVLIMGYTLIKYNFWSWLVIFTELLVSLLVVALVAVLFIQTSFLSIFGVGVLTLLVIIASFFLVQKIRMGNKTQDEVSRLSSELESMRENLKILDKKKSEFLAMVSHHLRDPLTAIKGYSSMLLEGSFGELNSMVHDAVNKMFNSSSRLIMMISDFMDITNIESGDMKYFLTRVNMKKLVAEVVDDMQSATRTGGLELNLAIDDYHQEDYAVVADLGKMHQVILSIIDNSIKYTPYGSISVKLSLSDDKKNVLFRISDTGIGMSEVTLQKIFKKFSRADGVNKTYTEGVGLGLYVAKKIIEKHQGRVWAESQGEGTGSSFFVEIPRAPEEKINVV
jgi:signal transduction histidine kinase